MDSNDTNRLDTALYPVEIPIYRGGHTRCLLTAWQSQADGQTEGRARSRTLDLAAKRLLSMAAIQLVAA